MAENLLRCPPVGEARSRLLAVLLASLASAPGIARAEGFALDRFAAPPAGDRFYSIESAEVPGHGLVSAGLLTTVAMRPLVLTPTEGEREPTALVGSQVLQHFGVGLALWNRLKLSVDFPLVFAGGDDVGTHTAPKGVSAGDLRTGARLVVLGGLGRPYRLALAGNVWVPTGDETRFAGEGAVRGAAQALLSGRSGGFLWGLATGVALRPEVDFEDTTLGDQLTFGAAAGVLTGGVMLSAEIAGASVLRSDDAFGGSTTNLELLFGSKVRVGPAVAGLAVGPGLASGVGTPSLRIAFLIAYAPLPGKHKPEEPTIPEAPPPPPSGPGAPAGPDRDADGIRDVDDACPDQPGPRSEEPSQNGCPLSDRDGDGVPDRDDVCPFAKGSRSQDPKRNGCPADADGDMILDSDDACPTIKGVMSVDPQKNGCPPDSDGDGARDDIDACPHEKGPADTDRTRNGCPTKLRVTEQAIELLEEVAFVNDEAAASSDELMKQIAGALADHPEVKRVAIDVHPSAGDKGAAGKRAASLKAKLVALGVAAGKIVTRSTPMPAEGGRAVVEIRIEDPKPGASVAAPAPPAPAPTKAPPAPTPSQP